MAKPTPIGKNAIVWVKKKVESVLAHFSENLAPTANANTPSHVDATAFAMIAHEVESVVECLRAAATKRASDLRLANDGRISQSRMLSSQVGGLSSHKQRMLRSDHGFILKPLRLDHRGIREVGFYEALKVASLSDRSYSAFVASTTRSRVGNLEDAESLEREANLLRGLVPVVPEYFGVVEAGSLSYLVLRDETAPFSKPCIMDVKIGTESYEPNAPESKRRRERDKYPPQTEFGFRIVALRVYDPFSSLSREDSRSDDEGFVFYSKSFGRSLATRSLVKEALVRYLSPGGRFDPRSASLVASTLNPILEWFLDNRCLRFCASSLLVVYEGDPGASQEAVVVKLIDFARVRRDLIGSTDAGCVLGIRNIIGLLDEILAKND